MPIVVTLDFDDDLVCWMFLQYRLFVRSILALGLAFFLVVSLLLAVEYMNIPWLCLPIEVCLFGSSKHSTLHLDLMFRRLL